MKICFLMYPWEIIDPETDSTIRLIHECAVRGHTIGLTTTSSLTIRNSTTSAFCNVLARSKDKISDNIQSFYKRAKFKRSLLPLAGFDVIFMRANPPLDTTSLNFLDSIREDTFIVNDIDGLRKANNKLYSASLIHSENNYIPVTHVSKNRDYLERVLKESDSDRMILKPLNGFGGRGVIVIEKSATHNFKSLLDFYIGEGEQTNYVILQEYVEGAHNGDVRILLLNGEPIGAMRRKPAEGDLRSNVHAGGTVVKHSITKHELALCKQIGPKLVRDGLYFVGLDVINGKLIEINVLSPGGITRINRLNRVKLQKQVIDFVENVVNAKELVISRKKEFKKVIEDAGSL